MPWKHTASGQTTLKHNIELSINWSDLLQGTEMQGAHSSWTCQTYTETTCYKNLLFYIILHYIVLLHVRPESQPRPFERLNCTHLIYQCLNLWAFLQLPPLHCYWSMFYIKQILWLISTGICSVSTRLSLKFFLPWTIFCEIGKN